MYVGFLLFQNIRLRYQNCKSKVSYFESHTLKLGVLGIKIPRTIEFSKQYVELSYFSLVGHKFRYFMTSVYCIDNILIYNMIYVQRILACLENDMKVVRLQE